MFNINICNEKDFRDVVFPLTATYRVATEKDVKKLIKQHRNKGTWAFVWQNNSSTLHDIIKVHNLTSPVT